MRICLIVLATAMVGCSAPTSPSPLPSGTPVSTAAAPPSGTPLATLAISSFELTLLEVISNGRHVYRPTLVLFETSAKSAAILMDVVFSTTGGDSQSILVQGLRVPPRVPPGQTWNLTMSPYYPAFVDIDIRPEIEHVLATVSFTDAEGRRGSVSSTAMATK